MEGDRVLVRAEGLRLTGLYPLRWELKALEGRSSPSGGDVDWGKVLDRLSYLPPMDVSIGQLFLPSVPPLAINIHQGGGRWGLHAEQQGGRLDAQMDLEGGGWQVDGVFSLAEVHAHMSGQAVFTGSGRFHRDGWTGRMALALRGAGRVEGGAAADADMEMDLDAGGWRVRGALVSPVGFAGGWTVRAGHVFAASKTFDAVEEIRVDLAAEGPKGRLDIEARWEGEVGLGAGSLVVRKAGTANLSAIGPDSALVLELPASGLLGPDRHGTAGLKGHVHGRPFDGTLTFQREAAAWSGVLHAQGGLWPFAKGGGISLHLPWRLEGESMVFSTGGRIALEEGLIGNILVRPVNMRPLTEVHLGTDGLKGRLELNASGVLSPRWILPSVKGELKLDGMKGDMALYVPMWGTRAQVSARLDGPEPRGAFNLQSPVVTGMAQGLNIIARSGSLGAEGTWKLGASCEVAVDFRLEDGSFDMGGISIQGVFLAGRMDFSQGRLRLTGTRPFSISRVGLGRDITDIAGSWSYVDGRWELNGLRASALGGTFSGARLTYPARDFETIEAADIDLSQFAFLQERPVVELAGRLEGEVPVRVDAQGVAVRKAWFRNKGPLTLRIPPGTGAWEMAEANAALRVALDTLSTLHVESLEARMDMPPDGWVDARFTVKGYNPSRGNIPVVLNYTHRENLFDLLRCLRMGQEVTEGVLRRTKP
ncbi:MAG: YdbH domain-containing protein [Deltaproteobacteria bacterium]